MPVQRYAAFLRGVSPQNLSMPALKNALEGCGLTDVRTLLSSGNVTFSARGGAAEAALARRIEAALKKHVGREFMTFVRSVEALERLLASDPYADFPAVPAAKRVVTFLPHAATAARKIDLPLARDGARVLCVRGTEIFSDYVAGPRGPVFMTLLQKTFGEAITTRTWDTVRKAAAAAAPSAAALPPKAARAPRRKG